MSDDTITVEARLAEYDYRFICSPLYRRLMPSFRWWMAGAILLAIIGLPLSAYLRENHPGHILSGLSGYLTPLAIAFVFLVSLYRTRLIWRAVSRAPLRQGVTVFTMDDTGLTLAGAGYRTRFDWTAIVDVVEDGKGGLLLLTGDVEAIPLPPAALPEGTAREALKARIREWIVAARDGGDT